jgi:hypothetical protein
MDNFFDIEKQVSIVLTFNFDIHISSVLEPMDFPLETYLWFWIVLEDPCLNISYR